VALSARTPTTIKTNLFVPAIYCNRIVDVAKDELVAWDCIDSSWESDLSKGDTLYIPKANTVTATEVVVGTKATALNPFNTTGVTLTIDQWYEAPVDLDYMTKRQSQADIEGTAVELAAFAVKEKIDTSVCALFSALNGSSILGSDGQKVTDDVLISAKQTLEEANVKHDGMWYLIVDPSVLADMMTYDKFIAADYVSKGAVTNGIIGSSPIYGCQVRVTNNLTAVSSGTGSYAVMMHKRAIGGAAQIQNAYVKEYEDLHQTRYSAEALWGVTKVNEYFGVPFYTRHA